MITKRNRTAMYFLYCIMMYLRTLSKQDGFIPNPGVSIFCKYPIITQGSLQILKMWNSQIVVAGGGHGFIVDATMSASCL